MVASSRRLLDDAGLLTAMAYVDLNPIRASFASTPEESEYTSIYERIKTIDAATQEKKITAIAPGVVPSLRAFTAASDEKPHSAIPITLRDYLELVDWTGRSVRSDKRGSISPLLPTILTRLNFDADA